MKIQYEQERDEISSSYQSFTPEWFLELLWGQAGVLFRVSQRNCSGGWIGSWQLVLFPSWPLVNVVGQVIFLSVSITIFNLKLLTVSVILKLRTSSIGSPGNLLQMLLPRPPCTYWIRNSGMGFSSMCFNKPARWFCCSLKLDCVISFSFFQLWGN